ncbi:MAG: diacylglycerol/lipid kinase family protein [Anaerolineae bacterium]
MEKIKLVINPYAGRGAGEKLAPEIQRVLQEAGVAYDPVHTTGPGEMTELVRQAKEDGYEVVAIVGGDGSVFEALNGLMAAGGDDVVGTLAIIPIGTGNDFIKMLDLPADWRQACHRLAKGRPRLVDVGRCNDYYFANVVGIGFDTLVAIEASKIKRLRGTAIYVVALFRTLLLTYATPYVKVVFDGQTVEQSITMIAVANGRCYGGTFWIAPEAEVDDGLFDLLLSRGLSRLGILYLVPHVMRGTHIDKEPVTMAKARKVVITSEEPLPVLADGEILYTNAHRLEMELFPKHLRVLV